VRFVLDREGRPISGSLAALGRRRTVVWGIRNINLDVGGGEGVALIGPNGAGKTTLLRTLAGVYQPDRGRVAVSGRAGLMLSLTAGLNGSLTGRENAMVLQLLSGLPTAKARAALPAVKARSGLGEAFEQQVVSYSAGMKARLGFSAFEQANPQVVLVDEVLGTVDHQFRPVAESRLLEVRAGGGILIAAGHDHSRLEALCSRAIRLDDGSIVADGPFSEVVEGYLDGSLPRSAKSGEASAPRA
jgi:ABC-type polysaccharide/polyol phosphate transport system ATPase subunit